MLSVSLRSLWPLTMDKGMNLEGGRDEWAITYDLAAELICPNLKGPSDRKKLVFLGGGRWGRKFRERVNG